MIDFFLVKFDIIIIHKFYNFIYLYFLNKKSLSEKLFLMYRNL
jgi:hypothetical protein